MSPELQVGSGTFALLNLLLASSLAMKVTPLAEDGRCKKQSKKMKCPGMVQWAPLATLEENAVCLGEQL